VTADRNDDHAGMAGVTGVSVEQCAQQFKNGAA
jgi:hypothetical protein